MTVSIHSAHRNGGFTLLEVMVSLMISTLIVGGVMGLMSVSLQFSERVKEKSSVQPVLEAAAQEIIAYPEKALDGSIVLSEFPEEPVAIALAEVVGADGELLKNRSSQLYRIQLACRGERLEFSILIPIQKFN